MIMQAKWHIENPLQCPLVHTLSMIAGKWKPVILHVLSSAASRPGELRCLMPAISQKMLTQQLRELVSDGLVLRVQIAQKPLHVEYRLSDTGLSVVPLLQQMYAWGANYQAVQTGHDVGEVSLN